MLVRLREEEKRIGYNVLPVAWLMALMGLLYEDFV
jgi:hypothetical protein